MCPADPGDPNPPEESWLPEPPPDLDAARRALVDGDLERALRVVGEALADDPDDAEARALLEEVAQRAEDPLSLLPLGQGVPFSIAACHAWMLAHAGQRGEAIDLLLQVLRVRPDRPYERWLVEWLEAGPPSPDEVISPLLLHAFLAAWVEAFPSLADDRVWLGRVSEALPGILEELVEAWMPSPTPTPCLVLGASALRRLGRGELALTWARRAHDGDPSWQTAVGLAMACAQMGHVEEAIAAYEEALGFDPDDLAVRLDLGDLLCKEDRFEEGLAFYDAVLAKEPEHPWARPSRLYARWLSGGEREHAEALIALAASEPDNMRAQSLSQACEQQQRAFVSYLPAPADSLIEVVQQATSRAPSGRLVSLTSSSLETPSARRACDWELIRRGFEPLPPIEVTHVQSPDPREPLGEVAFQLWSYEGTSARPNFSEPGEAVSRAVRELALEPFHIEAWWVYARDVARDLGSEARDELLAVMVQPPEVPEELTAWSWLQRVQIAATLIIARLGEGWLESERRESLVALLNGPADWTVSAAVLALAQIAREDSSALEDIAELFSERLQSIPDDGPVCYTYPLICATLRLPGLAEDTRAQLEAWKREFHVAAL